jgi:hypothetical protein
MFEIKVYKWDDCWWFDDINKNIIREELVLGTPEFIEQFIDKNEFNLLFSDYEIIDYDFKFTFNRLQEEGHIYSLCDNDAIEIWLCSVLLNYFDNVPNNLFIKCD